MTLRLRIKQAALAYSHRPVLRRLPREACCRYSCSADGQELLALAHRLVDEPELAHKLANRPSAAALIRDLKEIGPEEPETTAQSSKTRAPEPWQLKAYALHNFIPFIGFGFFDNLLMILAGDFIDAKLGLAFGISTMAAAAIGNTFSDVVGLWMSGFIEAVASRFGLRDHKLTTVQTDQLRLRILKNVSMIAGIVIGCTLGMFPLIYPQDWRLWPSRGVSQKKDFEEADTSGTGSIDQSQLMEFLAKKIRNAEQLSLDPHILEGVFKTLNKTGDGRINFSEFLQFLHSVDFNQDGDISAAEAVSWLGALDAHKKAASHENAGGLGQRGLQQFLGISSERAQALLAKHDADGNKALDTQEFLDLCSSARAVFVHCVTDNEGTVSLKSLDSYFGAGIVSPELFKQYDSKHRGQLEFGDFLKLLYDNQMAKPLAALNERLSAGHQ